jgi:hypothetical protein
LVGQKSLIETIPDFLGSIGLLGIVVGTSMPVAPKADFFIEKYVNHLRIFTIKTGMDGIAKGKT